MRLRRRDLMTGLGAVAVALPWPASAQTTRPTIGFLHSGAPGQLTDLFAGFHIGLKESGYIDGQNVRIEYRWAENVYEQLPALAADFVRQKVDVIATAGGDRSAIAAKGATSTIPIVSVIGGDPVATGLVSSLARPGGNLTGMSFLTASLTPKRFELLLSLVPQAKVIGLLVNPENPQTPGVVSDVREAVQAKGRELQTLEATNPSQIEDAFLRLGQIRVEALILESDPFFNAQGDQFVSLVTRYSIPAIFERRSFAAAGGLISYGTSLPDVYRGVGTYVGRILKGANPAELPVIQPTKFELTVNFKTAKALGLTVPTSIVAGADEIIE